MITPIDSLAELVKSVADRLFPDRTDASMYLKTYEEMAEVIASNGTPKHPGEVADLFILTLDYAKRHGIDIEHEVRKKLAVLGERAWTMTPAGTYKHIGEDK